jgi:hypothetical protein
MVDAPGLDNCRLVPGSSRLADVTFDWRVVGFTPTITRSSADALAWRLCGACSGRTRRARRAAAGGLAKRKTGAQNPADVEVALALVLAGCATLLAKTLYRLAHVDPSVSVAPD